MIDSIDDTRFGTAPQPLLKRDTPLAVAERAGISKGGLVYSFATKDGLVRAALALARGKS